MPTRQRPATAANSARLTNPNDRPQRRSTETFGIAHALCGAVFLCPKRNGRGGSVTLCGEWVVRSAGNASRSLRACVGAAWASGSAREGRVAVRGRAKGFGGEWVVRAAGLTHIRRSSTRARVLLYIRPPCPRREIAAMGPKDAPASTHRPRSLPHPPRPRLHFRTRVHTSPASPSTSPAEQSASRSSSYPQWVIHGKVIHIVARRPVQNVLALAPAHAYI